MLQQGQSDDDDDDGDDEDDDGDDDGGTDDGNDDDFPGEGGLASHPNSCKEVVVVQKTTLPCTLGKKSCSKPVSRSQSGSSLPTIRMSRKSCQPRHDKEGDVDDHGDAG